MKKLLLPAIALSLSFASYTASAEFIQSDVYVAGDNKAVLDTETGLEWLKLSETSGDRIFDYLNLDNGWRLATQDEATQYIYNVFDVEESDFTNGRIEAKTQADNFDASVFDIMGITKSSPTWHHAEGIVYNTEDGTYERYGLQYSKSVSSYYPSYLLAGQAINYGLYSKSDYVSIFLVSEGGASYSSVNDASYSQIQNDALAARANDVNAPLALSALGFSLIALVRLKSRKSS